MKSYFKTWIPYLKNKYIYTSILFVVFVFVFDDNNLIAQIKLVKKLHRLEQEKEYYTSEITKNSQQLKELLSSDEALEKFAREKFLMKKDNEDIFLFVD